MCGKSQRKGAAGEREISALLSANGYRYQRGGSRSFFEYRSGFAGLDSV